MNALRPVPPETALRPAVPAIAATGIATLGTTATGSAAPEQGTLEVRELRVGYGRRVVVSGLDLAPLRPGTLTALVGPNGAGKSTLLRALAGLVAAAGTVRLGGLDLLRLSPRDRARHLSYMPQGLPQGVALTVLESLISALRAVPGQGGPVSGSEATGRALALLERLGIADLALRPLDALSGGQRQLAGLAQALVREPAVLLLDEPTSALDMRHQVAVMAQVRDTVLCGGLIGVVVLHDLALAARFATRLTVLGHGAVAADGAPGDVLTPDLLARVYGVSARVERCSRGDLLVLADAPLPPAPR